VLFFGDLWQMPPVPVVSLYDVVVGHLLGLKARLKAAHRRAAISFAGLSRVELVQNMRCKDDKPWADLLAHVRDATPGARPLRTYLLPVLKQMCITRDIVVDADPLFREAMALVTGN